MKNISFRFSIFALSLLALGILPYFVSAASYTHTFTDTTNLVFTNSVDTHTMNPTCDGGSPSSYTWSLTVNGSTISGTHNCPPPGPGPTNLYVFPQACGTGQNYLDWDDTPGAASYSIYIYNLGWVGNSIGSNYTHTGSVSSSYKYYVRSNDSMGVQSGNSWYVTAVTAPPCTTPGVTLSASPTSIDPGDTSTLTWTATGATTCTATGGWVGNKNSGGGSEVVSPIVTTTYNLSCTGPGGTASATPVTITSPSGFISAGACTIVPSGSVEGTSCDVTVNWGAYDFVGAPVVQQGGTTFSSSLLGPETRSANPDNRSFMLRDTGGTFTSAATADVTCQAGTAWSSTASHCAFLPIVTITSDTNLIRSGATLDFEISVNSGHDLICTVRDGGVPYVFSHLANAATVPYPRTTRPLTSTQVVDVSCASPLDASINGGAEIRVNVIPTIQEV